ncbi:MAG: nuclear transport factor 2 family protein [Myxococcales bacterium]|nr:MAG: nuclear transport factor 2 family protein [Myxococcales bacterium]
MPSFPREELEEMFRRFVEANNEAGRTGDWSKMSQLYTDDAVYSWNNGSKWEFCARGRKQIGDWAYGTEMDGLQQWTYPYVRTLVDDSKGEVVGFWRQIAPINNPDGEPYEIAGTGGSWFRYAGDWKWCWQRDFFDHSNAGHTFLEMAGNGDLNEIMQDRIKKGSRMPGWIRRKGSDAFHWYETMHEREDG